MSSRHLHALSATENRPPSRRPWVIGPVSLFIAATILFCLVCLLYLWQDGQIKTAGQRVHQLRVIQLERLAENQRLANLALSLQSPDRIRDVATTLYQMVPAQPDQVQWVDSTILAPALAGRARPDPTRSLAATTRARPVSGPLAAWWQAAGHALAALFR